MGFFERNRQAHLDRGIDPARLPPGQYSTERFPVLHVGDVPTYAAEHAESGYSTNVPLADILDTGTVAYELGGEPLAPDHGHPARVVIPHLYFWKSAKWLRGLEAADPFREQRYS